MAERPDDIELADLYVRNKLTSDEEVGFEVRMLESPELQQHVQTALAIKESLSLAGRLEASSSDTLNSGRRKPGTSWRPVALAASVVLAVVSTVVLVKTRIESSQLKRQIVELSKPQTSLLIVPVNIMRSAGSNTPDVIVLKPSIDSVIQLDIELSGLSQTQSLLRFTLESAEEMAIANWTQSPSANGRAIVLLRSELLPVGLVQLRILDLHDNILDRHLLEFRESVD